MSTFLEAESVRIYDVAYRIAVRHLQQSDAEDVAQDIVIALLEREKPPTDPMRYAACCARRRVCERFRRLSAGEVSDDTPTPGVTVTDRLLRELDVRDLIRTSEAELGEQAVAALGFLLAGYTQAVIGETLGCSRQAAQRILDRSIRLLAARLAPVLAEIS